MVTRKYSVISELSEDFGFCVPTALLEIIIEGETLEEVKEIAPDAVDSALACFLRIKLGTLFMGECAKLAAVA